MIINDKFLNESKEKFENNRAFRVAQRAASNNGLVESSIDRFDNENMVFNVNLTENKIRNQKASGRCWMFAAMNVLEYEIAKKYNLKEFELSQNYTLFFDKLERCNYFFESILDTLDVELTDRVMAHLLSDPMGDGGQWDMIKNLIKKYGIVPKYSMPETENSSKTASMNNYLTKMLRMYARDLRNAHKDGKSEDELKSMVEGFMSNIYNTLSVSLGTPPTTVDFEARDKDDKLVSKKGITPKEMFELTEFKLDQYISIINSPTKDKPFYKSYTVQYLGNIVEGDIVKHVNVPIDVMKKAVVDQLKDDEPVWFGCDVGQFFDRKAQTLNLTTVNVFDNLDVDYNLNKEERLDYSESLMTHAMVFMGCDVNDDDTVNKYKVENSWGTDNRFKGHLVMSDEWFDEYMYQVLVNKKHLSKEVLDAYELEPVTLKPWDPMGSLA